jgi:hypothetical protein
MIRCGSDQTHVRKGGGNVTNDLDVVLIKHMFPPFFTSLCSEPHLIIGHIPPSFIYICLIRTMQRKEGGMSPMIRCGSDQTHVKKGRRNVTND